MSLRLKLMLSLIVLAVGATLAIGVASYTTTRHELEQTVDRSLDSASRRLDGFNLPQAPGRPNRPGTFEQILVQRLAPDGSIAEAPESGELPVTAADLRVATSVDPDAMSRHNIEIDGEHFRVLTVRTGNGGGAVMLARSLDEVERSLESILRSTLWAVIVVAVVSALVGWLIARQVTRRLTRLTIVAGVVASSGRLDVEVPTDGADESGKLGRAFAGMLQSLQRSKREQHQLVQDASHELRTPLTSLRTNVAVLRRGFEQLQPEAREQLLADLDSETRELSDLVNELVELATEARDDEPLQPMRLVDVVDRAAERTRRRFSRDVEVTADASLIDGRPGALERAVQNLLDNACKFAPSGAIEVTVADGTVTVRDHGPGLVEADIPHLFDRFYRSVQMRGMPGSGLGLAIVKSVAEAHGGTVFARNAAGGGAELGIKLNPSS